MRVCVMLYTLYCDAIYIIFLGLHVVYITLWSGVPEKIKRDKTRLPGINNQF